MGQVVTLAKRVGDSASRLLFPPHCLSCDCLLEVGLSGLCRDCRGSLMEIAEPFCKACGEPFEGVMSSEFRCGNCAYRKFHFEFAIAGYRSLGPVRGLIHSFKYSRRVALRRELAQMLLHGFGDPRIDLEQEDNAMLVPVPLHHRRRRERGFNQAEEVAKIAAKELELPVVNALRRIRYTETQVHMHRNQRLHNMRNTVSLAKSEAVRQKLTDATIYLVDDVLTTGATAQECARVLKKEGNAAKVIVVTICRAAGYSKPKL